LDGARVPTLVARQRIERAQLVEDGAANAPLHVDIDTVAARRVEGAQRAQHADHAGLRQILGIDIRGQLAADPACHLLNPRKEPLSNTLLLRARHASFYSSRRASRRIAGY